VRAQIGLYYEPEQIDWLTFEMLFDPSNPSDSKFSCSDGFSTVDDIKNIIEDDRINCLIDN